MIFPTRRAAKAHANRFKGCTHRVVRVVAHDRFCLGIGSPEIGCTCGGAKRNRTKGWAIQLAD